MKNPFQLEDFGRAKKAIDVMSAADVSATVLPSGPTPEEIEAIRMEGYDQGYTAGWEDAVNAQSQDQERIGTELARNLQDLGFTFHEAKSHVMKTLEPLLSEVVSKILPQIASETLGPKVIEELISFAQDASDAPIKIAVCPINRSSIEGFLDASLTIPLEILEEETLAEGQVYLRLGDLEKKIDMTGAIERIGDAIHSIYAIDEEA
jgi:flagellar assembly protein FliH